MPDFPFTPEQLAWIEDLETAEARGIGQAKDALVSLNARGAPNGWCCLGRACEVLGVPRDELSYEGQYQELSDEQAARLKLRSVVGIPNDKSYEPLTELNDGGKSFAQIAAILRAHPEQYFTNLDTE